LHFNGKRYENSIFHQNNSNAIGIDSNKITSNYLQVNSKEFILVGTIKVDEQSRLTFTKSIKKVLPIFPRDVIAVYKNLLNNDLLFKVQRFNEITDTWVVKKEEGITTSTANEKNSEIQKSSNLKSDNNYNGVKENSQSPCQTQLKKDARILIIDDEKDIIEIFKVFLSEFNVGNEIENRIDIDSFDSSSTALIHLIGLTEGNKINACYYDLIILDIRMPKINGIQLYQILKIIDPKVKILFITALETVPELINMLPGINPNDIIKKPVDMEDFLRVVEEKINL
jgi:CheY-like chemotaxis protein